VGADLFFIAVLMDLTELRQALDRSAAVFEKGLSPMIVMSEKGTAADDNDRVVAVKRVLMRVLVTMMTMTLINLRLWLVYRHTKVSPRDRAVTVPDGIGLSRLDTRLKSTSTSRILNIKLWAGVVMQFNESAEGLFGYSKDEVRQGQRLHQGRCDSVTVGGGGGVGDVIHGGGGGDGCP
jgi:PAS domain-containing protein